MRMIQRDYCVFNGVNDFEPLHTSKDFPVFMGCVDTPPEEDMMADMSWHISRSSGCVQLNPLMPLDKLYPESHGSGCVGRLWEEHHQAFARFVAAYKPSAVLEIGGSHGILAKNYLAFHDIPWTIVEPNPSPVENCPAVFIKAFFDDHFAFEGEVDAVVHSHVFEHVYEPDLFIAQLSRFMKPGQTMLFSVPNMEVMLQKRYTNCLNFEHTVFLTATYVEHVLAKYGYRVLEKAWYREDHSLFYATVRDSSVTGTPLSSDLYDANKTIFMAYIAYHEALVSTLNEHTASMVGSCYLFGAHIFSQYLLFSGLDASRIVCLLDNDVAKQGRRLYGTQLLVQSPKILADVEKPVIILKAGVYNDEIRQDILENINSEATFLE